MIVFFILFLCLLFVVFKTKKLEIQGVEKKYVFTAFLFKIIAAIALYGIYTYYYTDQSKSDIYKYFWDGEKLASIAHVSYEDYLRILFGFDPVNEGSSRILDSLLFWNKANSYGVLNDNQLIIRIDSLLVFLTKGSLFFSFLILSVFSFLSMVFLLRSFKSIFSAFQSKLFFLLLFFSPTILIWTSGALKEMLLVAFLCLSLGFLIRMGLKSLFLLAVSVFLLTLSKPQIGAIFIFFTLIYLMINKLKIRRVSLTYTVVMVVGLSILALNAYLLRPGYYDLNYVKNEKLKWEKLYSQSYEENVLGNGWNILEKLKFKQLGNEHEAKREHAKSYFYLSELDGTFLNFIRVLPEGMSNALFRPYFWEIKNVLMFIPSIENGFILIFFLWILYSFFQKRKERLNALIWFGIWYVIVSASFIGILTPVLGNLVRYKVAFLPVFYFVFVLLSGDELASIFTKKRNKNVDVLSV